jgi:predicted nuclease of predicted toxin-antitoxin system
VIIRLDAQLSPVLASWLSEQFSVQAVAVRDLALRDASDGDIFSAARRASAIVMTKDSDFVRFLEMQGSPPKVILITCGNTSNDRLKDILSGSLRQALALLDSGEDLVEISNP